MITSTIYIGDIINNKITNDLFSTSKPPTYYMFPAICPDFDGGYLYCVRATFVPDGSRERDKNFTSYLCIQQLTSNLLPVGVSQKLPIEFNEEVNGIKGPEDPRMLNIDNTVYISFNMLCKDGIRRMHVHNLNLSTTVELNIEGKEDSPIEKNWTMFENDNRLHFIYCLDPLIILKCDVVTGKCTPTYRETAEWPDMITKTARGGTNAIEIKKGLYLGFIHSFISRASYPNVPLILMEKIGKDPNSYCMMNLPHAFLMKYELINSRPSYRIVHCTPPFIFYGHHQIQAPGSLVAKNKGALITFTINDRRCDIIKIDDLDEFTNFTSNGNISMEDVVMRTSKSHFESLEYSEVLKTQNFQKLFSTKKFVKAKHFAQQMVKQCLSPKIIVMSIMPARLNKKWQRILRKLRKQRGSKK